MLTFKTNTSGLEAKLAKMGAASPKLADAAVAVAAEDMVRFMTSIAPRDTQRYARGWAMAGNAAGVGSFPVPPVIQSKIADKLESRLETQLARWTGRLEKQKGYVAYWNRLWQTRYGDKGRHDKWERDLLKKMAEADKKAAKMKLLVERAKEALEAFKKSGPEGALVIWGKGKDKVKNPLALSRLATVRDKAYGGTGKTFRAGGQVLVTLHNLEPHSSIVEKRERILARGLARVRSTGSKRMSKRFVDGLMKIGA